MIDDDSSSWESSSGSKKIIGSPHKDAEINFKHWTEKSKDERYNNVLKKFNEWNVKIYDRDPSTGFIEPKYVGIYSKKNGVSHGTIINFHQKHEEYIHQFKRFFGEK